MKRFFTYLVIAMALLLPTEVFAQALQIEKDVELMPKNLTASTNQRKDSKDQVCGLLLVNSTIDGLKFDPKTAVGNVKYENGTYHVYLSPGTKKLAVNDANGNKLILSLPGVQPKSTYTVTIFEADERGVLEIQSDPSGANVTLVSDAERIDLGTTPIRKNASIRVGSYNVTVSKKGFESKTVKNVKIKAGKTTKLGTVKLKRNK